jgi:nucleoside 2-deoxyribosyltransferase
MKEQTDLDSLLVKLLAYAKELVGAEGASIFLTEGDHIVLKATAGLTERSLRSIRYPIKQGVSGVAYDIFQPIVVEDLSEFRFREPSDESESPLIMQDSSGFRDRYDEAEIPSAKIRNLIAVPIISEKNAIGVIRCVNKQAGRFEVEDVKLLEIFAKTAAAAIEAREELNLAINAPYAFVLIPFNPSFRDVYELGIKNIIEALGMRCERVDEIEFNDSILAQIYKGIQRADIVIADMTGRNPNVFYEVGYAHALHKEVVLLTQDASDIPFDLKGHNHIVYSGQVMSLRERLERRLKVWLEEYYAK